MSNFTDKRRGFGGQSLTVEVWGDRELHQGTHGERTDHFGGPWLNEILNRALQDPSFTHIRLIDEYSTTIFNRTQLNEVEPELARLNEFASSDEEKTAVAGLVALAKQARDRAHHFLVFIGD